MYKKYHLITLLFIYLVAYFLCRFYFSQGMPLESYTAGWLYQHGFMYTWLLVIVLFLMNKIYTASFITIGTFLGIIIGDLIGGLIRNYNIEKLQKLIDNGVNVTVQQKAQAYIHYGILPIWFIVMLVFLVIGLILDKKLHQA